MLPCQVQVADAYDSTVILTFPSSLLHILYKINYPEESKALWAGSPAASFVIFTAGSVCALCPHCTHTQAHAILSYSCSGVWTWLIVYEMWASTKPI